MVLSTRVGYWLASQRWPLLVAILVGYTLRTLSDLSALHDRVLQTTGKGKQIMSSSFRGPGFVALSLVLQRLLRMLLRVSLTTFDLWFLKIFLYQPWTARRFVK